MSSFAAPGSATSGLQGYDLEGAGRKKVSKTEADYTGQAAAEQCQSCTMFMRPDACTKVRGKISAEGHCKFYDALARKTVSDPDMTKPGAPLRAAGIVLLHGETGHGLFIRRTAVGDHAGEWCFPGGKIEDGETAEIAAMREVLEEVGYEVDDDEPLVHVARVHSANVEFTTFFHRVKSQFEPKLNEEHDSYKWIPLEKPPTPLHPGVRAILPLALSAATELTLKAADAVITKRAGDTATIQTEETDMDNLSLFVQLRKVDAKQRIVYGTAVVEQPDRSGEIFDYKSSKPEFEKWSEGFAKATDGKSLGNVRSMHGNIACGKLTDIGFDDERKAIDVAAKIIDDNEWKKVEEGVYTGFSIGGKYLKRWQDGELKRYTAGPSEISLVDLPCVPDAQFSVIKADGTEEMRKFVTAEAKKAEPDEPDYVTNDMIAKRAEAIAKTEGGKWSDYMDTARVQLEREIAAKKIAKHAAKIEQGKAAEKTVEKTVAPPVKVEPAAPEAATPRSSGDGEWEQVWVSKRLPGKSFAKKSELTAALAALDAEEAVAKAAAPLLAALGKTTATEIKPEPEAELVKADGESDEEFEKRKFSAAERKKDAKSGAAESDGSYPIENAEDLHNAIQAYGRSKNKAKTKRHIMSRARALGLTDKLPDGWGAAKAADSELRKAANLYFMADLMYMLACVEGMEDRAEADGYGFGVNLGKDVTARFGAALVALGDVASEILDAVLSDIREEEREEAMSRLAPITDLLKRGARHSSADRAIMQKIHDHLVTLGGEDLCKAPKDKQKADTDPAGGADVGNAAAGHPGTAVNPKSDLAPYKAASSEDLAKMVEDAVKQQREALETAYAKMFAEAAEVAKTEIGALKKKIMVLEAQPAMSPPGQFRTVDKTIDTGPQVEKRDPVDDEALRQKAHEAQMRRVMGPR